MFRIAALSLLCLSNNVLVVGKLGQPAVKRVTEENNEDETLPRIHRRKLMSIIPLGDPPAGGTPLGLCEGDCDEGQCEDGLICFQRDGGEAVPGCSGGEADNSRTDYCIIDPNGGPPPPPPPPPTPSPPPPPPPPTPGPPKSLTFIDADPSGKLGECEGDCDDDDDCQGNLVCFFRDGGEPVPGCSGNDGSRTDYCINSGSNPPPPPTPAPPTPAPPSSGNPTRLKLYWEPGYYWQEETIERKWCMKCWGGCNPGNKLYITECSTSSTYFDILEQSQTMAQIRVTGTNLCLERQNKDIFLFYCANIQQQRWMTKGSGSKWSDYKWEITQSNFQDHCVTQRHHPKHGEEVELEPCTTARIGDTSYWNRY